MLPQFQEVLLRSSALLGKNKLKSLDFNLFFPNTYPLFPRVVSPPHGGKEHHTKTTIISSPTQRLPNTKKSQPFERSAY
jgi:hypothetical protein